MNRNILTLAIATQFAAVGAIAQTSDTTGMAGTHSFGSDWSESLGSAVFEDDGTVRSEDDLSSAWSDLSSEDQDMLRRDCEAYMEQSEDDDSADAGSDMGTGGDATVTADSGTVTSTDTGTMTSFTVSMDQMEEICGAVEDDL